jgi:hypothetical protein
MHCKPGKAKDRAVPIMKEFGITDVRMYRDLSAERYWTVVIEQDVTSIDELAEASRKTLSNPRVAEAFRGYHDFVQDGKREIDKRE